MSVAIALTTLCSAAQCRRRQGIPANRIWHVDVRQGPGSVRMAGWRCMFCGTDNTTPIKHLPKSVAQVLPSKSQAMARLAETAPVASPRAISAVPPAAVVVQMSDRQRPADMPATKTAPEPISAAMPIVGRRMATQPIPRMETVPISRHRGHHVSQIVPKWMQGDRGREVLAEALGRIATHGGDALGLSSSTGRFEPVDISLPAGPFKSEQDKRAFASQVLKELDELKADMLMLGGSVNGEPWQAILHFSAGAATFV